MRNIHVLSGKSVYHNGNKIKAFIEETLEEAAEEYSEEYFNRDEIQMRCSKISFIDGYKLAQEQILDFLHLEITERRDYSASKMCEKIIEFIENK